MHVVDEHGFLGDRADIAQRVVIDRGEGLARPYAAGVDAHGEEAHKRVSGLDMRYVDGIGVRQQGEAALRCQLFEQVVWQDCSGSEDTIPNRAEFLKTVRKT